MRIAIIGGGAVGAACAMFLRRLAPRIDVRVIEPSRRRRARRRRSGSSSPPN
jgi:2-polyprenyl-6-methoxyphenol hydroxylase-like FAD-dependent oxidoreductase